MKYDLGCGEKRKEGYVGIDIRQLPNVDIVADVRKLPLEDESAEALNATDVIEHIPYLETEDTLKEWFRVLKPNGVLELRSPDFFKIWRAAISRRLPEDEAFRLLFGDQSPEAGGYEAGGHKAGLSVFQWKSILERVGFVNISIEYDDDEYNLYLSCSKPTPPEIPMVEPDEGAALEAIEA